jgi:hypothetical protein
VSRSSLIAVALGLAGCAPRTAASPALQSDTTVAQPPAISLERTPCFGGCPVYTISVSSSGQVTFEGKAHVRELGTHTAEIPGQQVDALLMELKRAGYFNFASRYAVSEAACGRYVTDLPSAISTATLKGRTKRIEHDYGCGAAPGALMVLEQRIDEVLGTERWVEK